MLTMRERWMNYVKVQQEKGKQKGFTLVELMVVVAIIAILAAVAMPQFMSAGEKARTAKIKADTATISNAAQLYMVDKSTDTVPTVAQLYQAGYLAEEVKTPKGTNYTVSLQANGEGPGKHVVVTADE